MRFRTRELDLVRALDETFLRIAEIGLRVLEGAWSIIIIGFVAAVMSGLSDADADVPRKATATVVIACICTVYSGITILPMFFGGALFFSVSLVFDILFVAAWATLIGLWDGDATDSCRAFKTKYFDGQPSKAHFQTDCELVKAMFAFMIVNLVSFLGSAVIAFCLRLIELDYAMSWRVPPLVDKFDKRGRQAHCSCCTHNANNPSPQRTSTAESTAPLV
ncbi:uncharacterized protein PV07_11338 [Cladophialophora immunda]|uniref:MARVEL domain-containing protein n=1 Tax=Cladophialophora immunda TaxID=569365 RepID=A0A0D2ADY6_9EURO|nr:uncharacterized protein PV07_11338 [Cladophialophora immunda]KIW23112.1 hypothetical protein PV07_11338 [Cladophialophora immunda]OQU93534.1 hypothetical protein CLAIMM_00032 [Cladophialophora immunda]